MSPHIRVLKQQNAQGGFDKGWITRFHDNEGKKPSLSITHKITQTYLIQMKKHQCTNYKLSVQSHVNFLKPPNWTRLVSCFYFYEEQESAYIQKVLDEICMCREQRRCMNRDDHRRYCEWKLAYDSENGNASAPPSCCRG